MPGLVRKLLIFAAVDGLILQPAPPRNHPPTTQQAIKIDYRGNVGPLLKDRRQEETTPMSLEAHGIIGLLKVATSVFLVSICGREQVAQIRGKAVYKITDVVLIPLASQAEADEAIVSARDHVKRRKTAAGLGDDDYDSSESEDEAPSVTDSLDEPPAPPPVETEVKDPLTGQQGPIHRKTSVAEDVMQNRGLYGRFADKWFSKKGWKDERRRAQGLSSEEDLGKMARKNVDSTLPQEEEQVPKSPLSPATTAAEVKEGEEMLSPKEVPKALSGQTDNTTNTLLPKILRTTKMYFASGNFFFSYEYDLSRGIGQQHQSSSLPLHKQYDPLYFWNQHVISPFIDAGQHSFVLPLIQGFVGQRPFSIKVVNTQSNSVVIDSESTPDDMELQAMSKGTESDSETNTETPSPDPSNGKDFLLTLVSRRSTKRAGLRYLRRGVDDEGNAANTVETEQILSSPTWNTTKDTIFSFSQLRGSIPLFFSQSPYSLKPQVATWGSTDTNAKAFKRHFTELSARYGEVYSTSLVDKHGTEARIGELYERHAGILNENGGMDGKGKNLSFEWFDFHNVCRGMRFENVSKLMDTLDPFFKSTSWTQISNDQILHKQSGILRTNCMDCLDRTNVVQSACARLALEAQLATSNLNIDLQNDPSTSWFNTLWADNGDNISRQYAGTAALKGDFTRTRKRQITGALTDFGLTLTRYYNNIVNDYFAQALIDYLLGRATESIFAEFEADMKSSDYFIDVRKVREAAIERSANLVIEDKDEDLIHGWTLSVPTSANHLKTSTFEEAVLLLTEKALYFCRLDWGTEKVREFERIDLDNVQSVFRGVYITSTLAQRHMDEERNVGFVLRYRPKPSGELVRRNTRSLESAHHAGQHEADNAKKGAEDEAGRFLAFKALPPRSSVPQSSASPPSSSTPEEVVPENETQVVREICDEIARIANKLKGSRGQPALGIETAAATTTTTTTTADAEPNREENVEQLTTATEQPPHDEKDGLLHVDKKDIISVHDAKRSTGYLEQLGYSLKKLVWS